MILKKHFLVIILVASSFLACQKHNLTIDGTLVRFSKGTLKFYYHDFQNDTLLVLDSINIYGEKKFEYQTYIEEPTIWWLSLSNDKHNKVPIFLSPNENYQLFIDGSAPYKPVLLGSLLQDQYQEYAKMSSKVNLKRYENMNHEIQKYNKLGKTFDMQKYMAQTGKNFILFKTNMAITKYANTILAPYIALYDLNAYPKLMDTIFKSSSDAVKKTKLGQTLAEEIKTHKNTNP